MSSKMLARLESIAAKEEAARTARLAELAKRIAAEKAKVKELKLEDEGVAELIASVESLAVQHQVSVLKLLDLIAKKAIGETAKVSYRRKREPKVPKVIKEPAAKKVVAKKK